MKVTEVYINKEEITEYPLHEAIGNGYSVLIQIAKESIDNAIETYNNLLLDETVDTKELNINDLVVEEETGLEIPQDEEIIFSINIDGKEYEPFKDYYIYDNFIIFAEPLEVGSMIKITDEVNVTKIITKNSYNKNALFNVYSSEQKFKYNNKYTFTLNVNEEEHTISFGTQYDPFYCSISKIRSDMGSMINGVTDNQIAKLIYEHSKEVFITMTNNSKTEDLTDIEKKQYIQNIVRYKTDIDLCWLLYYAVSGKYGTITKQIGTIEIEKTTKLPYIETMLKRFQGELQELENQLNDGTNTVVSFVKAGDTSYTVPDRGVF